MICIICFTGLSTNGALIKINKKLIKRRGIPKLAQISLRRDTIFYLFLRVKEEKTKKGRLN